MSFYDHLTTFAGKPVEDFVSGEEFDVRRAVPALRVEYDASESVVDLFRQLLEQGQGDELTALVVGAWSGALYEDSPTEIIEALVTAADQLPQFRGLFLGDILQEENEISWIHQTDISALWQAFPRLEILGVRGSNELSLGKLQHNHLKQLTLESGGLGKSILEELNVASLPALEHLELYLGDSNYGWDGTVEDLAPLLSGKLFPKLKYLGLRNSEIADAVAQAVAQTPLLERLEVLDLSLGTLGDEGAAALVASPLVKKLKKLDLHRHFLSDEMIKQVEGLGIEVDLSDAEGDTDVDDRYVWVGE